jgi:hypothetical protein
MGSSSGRGSFLSLEPADEPRLGYTYFSGEDHGTFTPVLEVECPILGRKPLLRVCLYGCTCLRAGCGENPFKRCPVLHMQDGANLFFPEEAFLNREWKVVFSGKSTTAARGRYV